MKFRCNFIIIIKNIMSFTNFNIIWLLNKINFQNNLLKCELSLGDGFNPLKFVIPLPLFITPTFPSILSGL